MNDSLADIIVQRDEWMKSAKQADEEVVSLRATLTALVEALEAADRYINDKNVTNEQDEQDYKLVMDLLAIAEPWRSGGRSEEA